MATVYLARDLKHDRLVALKVLKPELAAVIGGERFLSEIKTTANLQHPHILALFDSGAVNGTVFYAMPFIDGESLRDKLAREKQLPIDDALRIAREVADALQYAHERGVIHRDIKPENILLQGGHALVADFGIAFSASSSGGARMTETGMSLGTPTYVSPEQAMGERTLDARTDVYALGCVVYEMLTGEAPFSGPTAQSIVAKVMTEKPVSLISRRDKVPAHVEDAVFTALEKVPADRYASAALFATALATPTTTASRASAKSSRSWLDRRGPVLIGALGVTAVSAVAFGLFSPADHVPTVVNRFSISIDASERIEASNGGRLSWSPDGRALVYAGHGGPGGQLWVRSLDALNAVAVTGSDGATSVSVSPNGNEIAFVQTTPFQIKVVARTGGAARIVVTERISGGGVDWASDGYLYFDGATEISRIRPDGSGRESVAPLDTANKEFGLAWPHLLPGAHAIIYRSRRLGDDLAHYRITAYDFTTKTRRFLVNAVSAIYSPSGHLLFVTADGALMAQRFNLEKLAVEGSPVEVAKGLTLGIFGAVDLAISPDGDLFYTTGLGTARSNPTWVTRGGVESIIDAKWTELSIGGLTLSPDGSRLAVNTSGTNATNSRTQDVWIKQLPSGPLSRLTSLGEQNRRPHWSSDGRDILFLSNRSGPSALYRQRADGSTPATRLATYFAGLEDGFESPDGKWIIAQTPLSTSGDGDILGMRVGVDTALSPLVATAFREESAVLSPDGNWLAYASNETGRSEIYLRPFPNVNVGKIQVSTEGGLLPQFGPRGDELFYRTDADDLMAAQLRIKPAMEVLTQKKLFSARAWLPPYAVSPDGTHFLMLSLSGAGDGASTSSKLILVQGFASELRRRLP